MNNLELNKSVLTNSTNCNNTLLSQGKHTLEKQKFRFADLANDLAMHVCSFCSPKELLVNATVSRKFKFLSLTQYQRHERVILNQFEKALYSIVAKTNSEADIKEEAKITEEALNPLKELSNNHDPMIDMIDIRVAAKKLISPLRWVVNDIIAKIDLENSSQCQSIYSEIIIKEDILNDCISKNYITIAKILIIWGTNIKAPKNNFDNSLIEAVRRERKEMVEFLLKHGANPNLITLNGSILNELYHFISAETTSKITSLQRIEILKMLIRGGADSNFDSWIHQNPVSFAVIKGACLEAIFLGAKGTLGLHTNIHLLRAAVEPIYDYRLQMAALLNNSRKINPHFTALAVGYNYEKESVAKYLAYNSYEFDGELVERVMPKIDAFIEMRNKIALTVLGVFKAIEEAYRGFHSDVINVIGAYLNPYVDEINSSSYLLAQHKIMHLFFREYLEKYTDISIDEA